MLLSSTVLTNPAFPSLESYSAGEFFSGLIRAAIAIAFLVGFIVFVFMFISGGIAWISSGGNRGKIEEARSKLITALTGLAVLLLVFFVIQIIEAVFSVSITNINLTSFYLNDT